MRCEVCNVETPMLTHNIPCCRKCRPALKQIKKNTDKQFWLAKELPENGHLTWNKVHRVMKEASPYKVKENTNV